MTQSFRNKAIAVGTGVLLTLSLSGVTATADEAYPPGVTPVKCKIKTIKHKSKLKINVNPNQGSGFYKFKIDKKIDGKWYRYLHNYKTEGSKETKVVNVKKGKYRAHCIGKYGYTTANSKTVKIKK